MNGVTAARLLRAVAEEVDRTGAADPQVYRDAAAGHEARTAARGQR